MKNEYFILVAVFCFLYVINVVKKGNFSISESIFWFFGSFIALFIAVFPEILDKISLKFGISYPPSLLFFICIIFLILVNFRVSRKTALNEEKLIELGQKMSLLEFEVMELKNDKKSKK